MPTCVVSFQQEGDAKFSFEFHSFPQDMDVLVDALKELRTILYRDYDAILEFARASAF